MARVWAKRESLVVVAAAALLAGCAGPQAAPPPNPFAVPWVGVVVAPGTHPVPAAVDDLDVFATRYPPYVDGPVPIFEFSAYSIYTYDAQPIGSCRNPAYRNRTIYQSGASVP